MSPSLLSIRFTYSLTHYDSRYPYPVLTSRPIPSTCEWYSAVSRSTRIAYVCNTLVTTEHKHYDSVYSVNELHKKSCVNGVACTGILESFAVDGISFKVAAAMGKRVNSPEKITLGFLLILLNYRGMDFIGRINYYRG